MEYGDFLETVDEVDGMLTEKSYQLRDVMVHLQRRILMEQVDCLLDLRNVLGRVAVEGVV